MQQIVIGAQEKNCRVDNPEAERKATGRFRFVGVVRSFRLFVRKAAAVVSANIYAASDRVARVAPLITDTD
jgi:hypothetical protein